VALELGGTLIKLYANGEKQNQAIESDNQERPIVKKVFAQDLPPAPQVIDIESLQKGVYSIQIKGFDNALVEVYSDNVKLNFYLDVNSNGVKDQDEPVIDVKKYVVNISKEKSVEKINLSRGWNLISLPIFDQDLKKASDLARLIESNGGRTTQVSKFDNGNWIHFINGSLKIGGKIDFGIDFNLIPGQSYFVYAQIDSEFVIKGNDHLDNPLLSPCFIGSSLL